jgi:PST family polysaccharide transporter
MENEKTDAPPVSTATRSKAVVTWNFISLASLDVFNYLLPIITFPYLVRVPGPKVCGIVFAASFIQYFITITDYGFTIPAARAVAVVRNNPRRPSKVSSIVLIKVCLTLLCFTVMAVTAAVSLPLRAPKIELFGFGLVVPMRLPSGSSGVERMRYITALGLCAKIC